MYSISIFRSGNPSSTLSGRELYNCYFSSIEYFCVTSEITLRSFNRFPWYIIVHKAIWLRYNAINNTVRIDNKHIYEWNFSNNCHSLNRIQWAFTFFKDATWLNMRSYLLDIIVNQMWRLVHVFQKNLKLLLFQKFQCGASHLNYINIFAYFTRYANAVT